MLQYWQVEYRRSNRSKWISLWVNNETGANAVRDNMVKMGYQVCMPELRSFEEYLAYCQ